MKNVLFLFVFVMIIAPLSAQKTITIDSVSGSCVVRNITPENAQKTAIELAKNKALQVAGISENITSFSAHEIFENNHQIEETFTSVTNIHTSGKVADWEIINERKYVNELNDYVIEVTLRVSVVKHTQKPDPNFTVRTEGLQSIYANNTPLNFKLHLSQKGYLHVLLQDGDSVSQIYPNYYEPSNYFEQQSSHYFPTDPDIDYELNANRTKNNNLIIIYTKNKSSVNTSTIKPLLAWLYTYHPDQLYFSITPFTIQVK